MRRRAHRPTHCRRRRVRDISLGLAAAIGLLALLAGPPLLVAAGYRAGDLSSRGWAYPTGRLSDADLVTLLALVLAVTWLRWLACLAVEAVAAVRCHGLSRRVPLLTGWEQVAARRLVGAVLGLLTSASSLAPAAAAAAAPASRPVTSTTAPAQAGTSAAARLSGADIWLAAPSAATPPAPTRLTGHNGLPRYVVQAQHDGRHDTLWSIAERYLGDGRRYTEIYALNKDRPQPDGHRLQLAALIRPGWELLLPADASGPPSEPSSQAASGQPDVVVHPGDTLSGIAQRYLGQADRYPEIFALNAGRTQPDGSRLTDPNHLLPGLHLRLPAHRAGSSNGRSTRSHPRPPGDRAPRPSNPPATHSPRPAAPAAPSRPQLTPAQPSQTSQPSAAPSHPVAHPRHVATPAWVAGGTLLAGSFAGLLVHRRRRRDAHVRPGQTAPPPDPDLIGLHTAVLATANPAGADRLAAALQQLAAAHTSQRDARERPVPQVLLRHPDGTVDVFLRDSVDRLPAPWHPTGGGQIWTLPRDAPADGADRPPPCPALVQLGTTDDGAELYVDLEALGILAVDATGADLRALARAGAATLTLSPYAELVQVRTVGFDPYGLADEERLTPADDTNDLLGRITSDTAPIAAALNRAAAASTFALRAADPDENWEPTVAIIAGQQLDEPTAARLAEIAGAGGRGLAVVAAAAASLPARWHLTVESTTDTHDEPAAPRWRLDPLGISLSPLRLAAEELADLTALLAEASAPPEESQPAPDLDAVVMDISGGHRASAEETANAGPTPSTPDGTGDPGPPAPARTHDRPQWTPAGEWAVMVRLIGPVDVIGRDNRTPSRPIPERTLEVLAWLVTHRTGATRLDLEAAIWPASASAGTIMNQLSRARRVLEQLAGPAAHDWIPARTSTLGINSAVISDLDLLRVHLATADHHADQPDLAIPALQTALDLVRGVPARYPWLEAETGSTLTTLPTTTAARLAQLHLDSGDLTGVLDATTRGLAILPAHTELFALRMRAAAATGDRAGIKAEYEAYLRAEQADPLWDGETDRDLQRLYQELLRPPRHAAAG